MLDLLNYIETMESMCTESPSAVEEPDLVVKIRELNPHIVCGLCVGYLIDATTITECSHTFCKSCIVKHFQTKKSCPECGQKIHETQPLNNLRSDRVMQDVVYKLVPNLFKSEQEAEAKFYSSKGMDFTQSGSHLLKIGTPLKYTSQKVTRDVEDASIPSVDASSIPNCRNAHRMHYDEKIVLYLKLHPDMENAVTCIEDFCLYKGVRFFPLSKNFVRCSSRVTVSHVKKLLRVLLFRHKVDVEVAIQVCNGSVPLSDQVTMKQIFLSQSASQSFTGLYVELTFNLLSQNKCTVGSD